MQSVRMGMPLGGPSLLVIALALTIGCSDDEDDHHDDVRHDDAGGLTCGPAGRSVACTGPGGCEGAQVCQGDGSYGECDCDAEAASRCAPAGILVSCVGDDDCAGHQACGADGVFGPCECADIAGGAVTALEITSPSPGDAVSGTLEVQGIAEGDVVTVAVAVGGGPLLVAEGTDTWNFSIDVSRLVGPTTIRVIATGGDGGELQRWIEVRVVDPLVGTWSRTQPGDCVITFYDGGELDLSRCPSGPLDGWIQSFYSTWRRSSGDIIVVGEQTDGSREREIVASVGDDGEMLTLTNRNRDEMYVRGTPDFGDDAGTD